MGVNAVGRAKQIIQAGDNRNGGNLRQATAHDVRILSVGDNTLRHWVIRARPGPGIPRRIARWIGRLVNDIFNEEKTAGFDERRQHIGLERGGADNRGLVADEQRTVIINAVARGWFAEISRVADKRAGRGGGQRGPGPRCESPSTLGHKERRQSLAVSLPPSRRPPLLSR